jgi:hypothetical protein
MFDTPSPDIALPDVPDAQNAAVPQPEAPPARPSAGDDSRDVQKIRNRLRRRRGTATSRQRSRIVRPGAASERLGQVGTETVG